MTTKTTTHAAAGGLAAGCPGCGSGRPALLWATDPGSGARTYRCQEPGCGARWSVDGVQAELDLGPIAPAALTLAVQTSC